MRIVFTSSLPLNTASNPFPGTRGLAFLTNPMIRFLSSSDRRPSAYDLTLRLILIVSSYMMDETSPSSLKTRERTF